MSEVGSESLAFFQVPGVPGLPTVGLHLRGPGSCEAGSGLGPQYLEGTQVFLLRLTTGKAASAPPARRAAMI